MDTTTQTALGEIGLKWNHPSVAATEALKNSKISTKLLHNMNAAEAEDLRNKMMGTLARGPVLGMHPNAVAALMKEQLKDSIVATEARYKNIARTEILDAYRGGAKTVQQANADILQGWVWMSVLGFETCPSCIAMHGTMHDLSENGPDDHPQGRCYRMPQTKNWADLGLDIVEPPSLLPDNQSWFESLDLQQQYKILGPKRAQAYWSGDYPMDKWAQSVSNPAWRRSFHPSKVEGPHTSTAKWGNYQDKIVSARHEVGDQIVFTNNIGEAIASIPKAPPPPAGPAWLKNLKPKIDKLPGGDGEWQVSKSYKVIRQEGKLRYEETYKGKIYKYDNNGVLVKKVPLAEPPTMPPNNWVFKDFEDAKKLNLQEGSGFPINPQNYATVVKKGNLSVYNSQADHYFLVSPEGKILSGPWKSPGQYKMTAAGQKLEPLHGKPFSTANAGYKPSYGYGGKKPVTATQSSYQAAKPASAGQPGTVGYLTTHSSIPKGYVQPTSYGGLRQKYPRGATRPATPKGTAPVDELQWAHAQTQASSQLTSYRGGGYGSMNDSYRTGTGSSSARELARQIEDGGYTFKDEVTLFRGVRESGDYRPSTWKVGSTQTEKGFMSVSGSLETAARSFGGFSDYYANTSGWFLKVKVKPGQKWLPGTDYEYEVIMKPGMKFKVVKRDDVARVIEIELL